MAKRLNELADRLVSLSHRDEKVTDCFYTADKCGYQIMPQNSKAFYYDFMVNADDLNKIFPDDPEHSRDDEQVWKVFYVRGVSRPGKVFKGGSRSVYVFLDKVMAAADDDYKIAYYLAKNAHTRRQGMLKFLKSTIDSDDLKYTVEAVDVEVTVLRHIAYHSVIGTVMTGKVKGDDDFSLIKERPLIRMDAWPTEIECEFFWAAHKTFLAYSGFVFSPIKSGAIVGMNLHEPKSVQLKPVEFTPMKSLVYVTKMQMFRKEILMKEHYRWITATAPLRSAETLKNVTNKDDITGMLTRITSKTGIEKFTQRTVSAYLRARHDLLAKEVTDWFDGIYTDDVKLDRIFNVAGERPFFSRQTPDFVIHPKNCRNKERVRQTLKTYNNNMGYRGLREEVQGLIVDFFVTDAVHMAWKMKESKYDELARDLSEYTGEKFAVLSIGFNILERSIAGYQQVPPQLRSKLMSITEIIKSNHDLNIGSMPLYAEHKKLLEQGLERNTPVSYLDEYFGVNKSQNLTTMFKTGVSEFGGEDPIKADIADYGGSVLGAEACFEEIQKRCQSIRDEDEVGLDLLTKFDDMVSFEGFKTQAAKERDRLFDIWDKSSKSTPKIFKFPKLFNYEDMPDITANEILFYEERKVIDNTPDGTYFFKEAGFHYPNPEPKDPAGVGIGLSAVSSVEEFITIMSMADPRDPVGYKEYNAARKMKTERIQNIQNLIEEAEGSVAFKQAYMLQRLAVDISKMLGRKNNKAVSSKKTMGASMIRSSGKYAIAIAGGPNLGGKQIIKFKLYYSIDTELPLLGIVDDPVHHHLQEIKPGCHIYSSDYLSLTITDLESWLRVYDRTRALFVSSVCHKMSFTPDMPDVGQALDKSFIMQVMMLMEQRRHTSTTLQSFRYLVQSSMSVISDRAGLVKKVFSDPVRTMLQMYVLHRMLLWLEHTSVDGALKMKESLSKLSSKVKDTTYDTYMVRSLYNDSDLEFASIMDEMYTCNLFNKNHGFKDHRVKPIMEKTAEDERAFEVNRMKERPELLGKVRDKAKFLHEVTDYHMFDRDFVFNAAQEVAARHLGSAVNAIEILDAFMERLDQIASMRSSVEEIPYKTVHGKYSYREKRNKLYGTQRTIMLVMGAFTTLEVMNLFPYREIYMGMFPKAQIGGPREIFIQDMLSRSVFRVVEMTSMVLCKKMPQEMIVKGDDKFVHQTDNFRKVADRASASKKKYKIKFSANRDASHWSPAWNCLLNTYMYKALGFPPKMTSAFAEFFSAMLHKKIGMPPELRDKWVKKPFHVKERNENLQWMREQCMDTNGVMRYSSGFCQGALHYTSSLAHSIHNTIAKRILVDEAIKMGVEVQMEGMVSSDDSTDCILIAADSIAGIRKGLAMYTEVWRMVYRFMNIHENLKKSVISMVLCEFNSCFILGRRALLSDIKDVYNAVAVVDMTYPEDSVREHISNESRLLDSGCNLATMEQVRVLNRNFNIDTYMIRGEIPSLCCKLGITDPDLLPYTLGFIPNRMLVESMIFGPDIYLTDARDSPPLEKFYSRVMSYDASQFDKSYRTAVEVDTELIGKVALHIDTRLTERTRKFKEQYIYDFPSTIKGVDEHYGTRLDMPMTLEELQVNLDSFILNQGRKDAFGDTAAVHSLIRASALGGRRLLAREIGAPEIQKVFPQRDIDPKVRSSIYLTLGEMIEVILAKDARHAMTEFPNYRFFLEVRAGHEDIMDILSRATFDGGRRIHFKMRYMSFNPGKEMHFHNIREFAEVMDRLYTGTSKMEKDKIANFERFFHAQCSSPFVRSVYELVPTMELKFKTVELILNSLFKLMTPRKHMMASESVDTTSWRWNVGKIYLCRAKPGGIYVTSDTFGEVDAGVGSQRLMKAGTIMKYARSKEAIPVLIRSCKVLRDPLPGSIYLKSDSSEVVCKYLSLWAQLKTQSEPVTLSRLFADNINRPIYAASNNTHLSVMPNSCLMFEYWNSNKTYYISYIYTDDEPDEDEAAAHLLYMDDEVRKVRQDAWTLRSTVPKNKGESSLTGLKLMAGNSVQVAFYKARQLYERQAVVLDVSSPANIWELSFKFMPSFSAARMMNARIARGPLNDNLLKSQDFDDTALDEEEVKEFLKIMNIDELTDRAVMNEMWELVPEALKTLVDLESLPVLTERSVGLIYSDGLASFTKFIKEKMAEGKDARTAISKMKIVDDPSKMVAVSSKCLDLFGELARYATQMRDDANQVENIDDLGIFDDFIEPSSGDEGDEAADPSEDVVPEAPTEALGGMSDLFEQLVKALHEAKVDWSIEDGDSMTVSMKRRELIQRRFSSMMAGKFGINTANMLKFSSSLLQPERHNCVDYYGAYRKAIRSKSAMYMLHQLNLLNEIYNINQARALHKMEILYLFLKGSATFMFSSGHPEKGSYFMARSNISQIRTLSDDRTFMPDDINAEY